MYGPIRYLRLIKHLRREKETPTQHYLTVCAIAKNEGPYFQEWIEWHKNLGVEKFYVYDNESTDNTKDVLAPYIESGLVEYVFFPGKKKQLAAYHDCMEKRRLEAHWIAMIDIDEFIVPIKDKTIPDFLKRFENFSAVEINWLIYGSGGAKEKEAGGVMERFKHHSLPNHKLNRRIKSIVNPRKVLMFIGCHDAVRISGCAATPDGEPIRERYRDREPQQETIRINHYAVKSYAEFLEKRTRGKATSNAMRPLRLRYFDSFDLNDIEES